MGIRSKKEDKPKPPKYQDYISLQEYNLRKKAWDEYYPKVKTSKTFLRYQEIRKALVKGDMTTVKRLANEAKRDMEDGTTDNKPPFPDPYIERFYKRVGVVEWDKEATIGEIFYPD